MPYPGDDDAVGLGRRIDAYVCGRADCAFPATIDVIRELAASHDLHTATGNPSWRVEALLDQWGVRDLFGVTAGADLAGVMKDTAEFDRRVFELARVDPERAIVVDDDPAHLARVRSLGARTILVAPDREVYDKVADDPAVPRAGTPEGLWSTDVEGGVSAASAALSVIQSKDDSSSDDFRHDDRLVHT